MKRYFQLSCLCIFLQSVLFAQVNPDTIAHGVYNWPLKENKTNNESAVLFSGTTHDFSLLELTAIRQLPGKKITLTIPRNEELLLIVRSGLLSIGSKDSVYQLPAGSVALLMPGEKPVISSADTSSSEFYTMRYRSKMATDLNRGDTAGGNIFINWNEVNVKTNSKGFRRDFFNRATALCRNFEMHVTTLQEGLISHEPHRHPQEEIIINIDNDTEMLIGEKNYQGGSGAVYFMTSGILHGIKNNGKGSCSYFAFRIE